LPTGSPDWPPPRRRFARCAMSRYASSHSCRPSAAAWPSNSPPSATAEADGGIVTDKERYQNTKRRPGRQRGPKVAQIELARKLAEAIWHMLTGNQPFAPAGATFV
jgi:hypothetical protein